MAAKGKVKSASSKQFAKGGSTSMFGKQNANAQAPGGTAHKTGKPGGKGGSGKMFGKQSAGPMLFAGRRTGKSSTEEKLPSRAALASITKGDVAARTLNNYAKVTPNSLGEAYLNGIGLTPPQVRR
jgi:hypothetical protein